MAWTKNSTATNNHGKNRGPRKMKGIIDMCEIMGSRWNSAGRCRLADAGRIVMVVKIVG
jgi:hypothetical protein